MKVGYARVSTAVQNLDLQLDSLKEHGCEELFTDKASGAKDKRQGLEDALRFVRPDDTLVVWRLDRLGRNMQHLIKIVNNLNEKGISFHSLQENITMDKASATGQLMFHLFAAFAEFERNLIQERSAAGRAAARARGRLGGRPEKLSKKEVEMIRDLTTTGTPIKDIAEILEISRTTVYRYLEK
ncbi:recombinase family protein [Aneurinibacillus aneurinilyticus]|uniref:recombinase family protein n=1 Tax=Aneurinibacillus aneurinilyticus TaxID=1391 RepID=UPI002E1F80F0|nr:recombinase family protein [Aneurinibacillus aneurinilyticus]